MYLLIGIGCRGLSVRNVRILLVNLFPPSKANLSAYSSPWSWALKEAIGEAQFSTLHRSPTVSVSFREIKREACELGHIMARVPLAVSYDQHLLDGEPLSCPTNRHF